MLIVFAFTVAIYFGDGRCRTRSTRRRSRIVDEDQSPLSTRIVSALLPAVFPAADMVTPAEMDARMDAGRYTFALDIPPNFQRDVLAGRAPAIQLNVDATRVSQAFTGSGYVQTIVTERGARLPAALPRRRRTAGRSRAARALQPDLEPVLVRRRRWS